MPTFGGHSFLERGNDNGYSVPGWERGFVLAEKLIPNGEPVIQSIGAKAARMSMPIRVSASELAALVGDCDGDVHTLVWSGGSDSAILESIGTPLEVRPGVDLYFATLNLIKT